MGNSTKKLQDVVDYVATVGELAPVINAAGFATMLARVIANDVMSELLAERFNWKWNRILCTPFPTISWQQDYAMPLTNIGWLENACAVDINNTALPKPLQWLECVRDLPRTAYQLGQPQKISWDHNLDLIEPQWSGWPGVNFVYTNPVGASGTPANKYTNLIDAHGNYLKLTTFGTTGSSAPDAGASPVFGSTVNDGSCVWTVLDPNAQGFRITPLPPQSGVVWQIHVTAQKRPVQFTSLQQTLDPVPDDYCKWFQDGYIAYAHRHSPNPATRDKFERAKLQWLAAMDGARKQGDREKDDAGFVPATGLMSGANAMPLGPAYPFGPFGIR